MSRISAAALALFLAALGVVWGPAGPASACSCVGGTPAEFFDRADVVFTGTLVSREVSHPSAPIFSSGDPALHVFAVDTVFKGEAAQRQGVVSADNGASCGLELSGNGPFVVFANRDADLAEGQYAASLCGGSGPLTAALDADLRRLGATAGPPPRPAPGSAGIAGAGVTGSGTGPWPWLAGGAAVLMAGGLIWLQQRRVLSGK